LFLGETTHRFGSASTLLASSSSFLGGAAATLAKYMITFLVFSVFPAPDSPLWWDNGQTLSTQRPNI
jgi:hypothetical protein